MGGLTADMSREMLGVTPAQHRDMKGLKQSHDLRDNMDKLELAVCTLGEQAAKTLIEANDPGATGDFHKTKASSMTGAKIAGDARRNIEQQIGRPVANGSNFLPKAEDKAALPKPRKSRSK